mgnify:FL=1
MNGTGLLTIEEKDKGACIVFSSPIAPSPLRVAILLQYLDCIFQTKEIKKVTLELEDALYKKFISALPQSIKSRRINYTLTWPIYNLKNFDASLSGNRWKTLRKEKNKFYQSHSVSVLNAKTYENKEVLCSIIDQWRKKRGGSDRAHFLPFYNFIDSNFKGSTESRVLVVDGKVCGINAGWMIPNSNRFYGSLGIHDYSISDLGDMLYLEDLAWLRAKGYKEADMGGGEDALTNFKNKFKPESFYKTHVFSVAKKQ